MKKQPLKEMFKKIGGERLLNEVDYTKVVVPAQVKKWMGKFVGAVEEANLNKLKRLAILFAVIKALGINQKELLQYMQRIKREM